MFKKLLLTTTLLAAALLGSQAWAATVTQGDVVSSVNDLTEGDLLLLYGPGTTLTSGRYFTGTSLTSSFDENNVFVVEFVSGSTTEFYLKQLSTGKYVADTGSGSTATKSSLVEGNSTAFAFQIQENATASDVLSSHSSLIVRLQSSTRRLFTAYDFSDGRYSAFRDHSGNGGWSVWVVYQATVSYSVTIPTVDGGSISVNNGAISNGNNVELGAQITITATPNAGYQLETLTVTGATANSDGTYTVTGDVEITASFIESGAFTFDDFDAPTISDGGTQVIGKITHISTTGGVKNISFDSSKPNDSAFEEEDTNYLGYVSPDHDITAYVGSKVEFDVRVISGWGRFLMFAGTNEDDMTPLLQCGCENNPGGAVEIYNNKTLYVEDTFSNTNKVTDGTLPSVTIPEGTEVGTEYLVRLLLVEHSNNAPFYYDGTYTQGQYYDFKITVVREVPKYAITLTESEHGTYIVTNEAGETIANGDLVEEGTTLTVTATNDNGYTLNQIIVNGTALATGETTFPVTKATTVEVTFSEKEYDYPRFHYDGQQETSLYMASINYTAPNETAATTIYTNTTGREENADHEYIVVLDKGAIIVRAGDVFKLNFAAAEDENETDDVIKSHAELFADWNCDKEFVGTELSVPTENNGVTLGLEGDEYLAIVGRESPPSGTDRNNVLLGYEHTFTVPSTASVGTSRIRIKYNDAWHTNPSYEDNNPDVRTHGPNGAVYKGMVVDIPVYIAATVTVNAASDVNADYTLTKVADGTAVTAETAVVAGTQLRLANLSSSDGGRRIASVTWAGTELTPNETDGSYLFPVNDNGTLTITTEEIPTYDINIQDNGTVYKLIYANSKDDASNEGVLEDTELELFIYNAPAGQAVSSVTLNGTPLTTTNGVTYPFTVTADADVVINLTTYCYPTDGELTYNTYYVETLALNCADAAWHDFSLNLHPAATHNVYLDYTGENDSEADKENNVHTSLPVVAGKTVTITATCQGTVNRGYLYVDWNKDGVFNTSNELVSKGTGMNLTADNMPSFTVPEGLVSGQYRARFKVDYENEDPCTLNDAGFNVDFGSLAVDFLITVDGDDTDLPTAIEEVENTVELYYNNGNIYTNVEGEIQVYDLSGKLVRRAQYAPVAVDDLANGIYIVRVNGNTLKFVK